MKAALSACSTFEKYPKEEFSNLDEFYNNERRLNSTLNLTHNYKNYKEYYKSKEENQNEEIQPKNEISLHRQNNSFHPYAQDNQLNLALQNKKIKDQKLNKVSKNQSFSFINNKHNFNEDYKSNLDYDVNNNNNYGEEYKDKPIYKVENSIDNKLRNLKSISIMKNHINHINLNNNIEKNQFSNSSFPKVNNSIQLKNIKINPQILNKIKKSEFVNNYDCEKKFQEQKEEKIEINNDNKLNLIESNTRNEINIVKNQELKNQLYKSQNLHSKQHATATLKEAKNYRENYREDLPKERLNKSFNTKSVPKKVFYKFDAKVFHNEWDMNSSDVIIENNAILKPSIKIE